MEASIYLSACAIGISFVSLAWAIHIGRRDRGKLKTSSRLRRFGLGPEDEEYEEYLEVKAVNCGRRPIILTMLGADFPNGGWIGGHIKDGMLRLAENEAFTKDIRPGDPDTMPFEGEEVIDLWFEDTLGRRYKVKDAKKNLKKLFWKG